MNQNEFLIELANILDYEDLIGPDQDVATIDVWDSLGILSVMQLLSDIGIKIQVEKITELQNIDELLKIVKPFLKD
jgi:acyl carrier protein